MLGALKADGAPVVKAVGAMLENPNPVLKDFALRYFEEVQPKNNTVQLLKMLDDPDKEIQERAVRSLSGTGQPLSGAAARLGERVEGVAAQRRAGAQPGARQSGAQRLATDAQYRYR